MKMKILKSIENALAKGKKTIRQDTVKKAIERGEFEMITCAFHLTDDYALDASRNFGRGQVSAEYMMREYSILTPSCWISGKKNINGKECHEISIMFHSNLSYDMYVPVA
jgi:hypothetical protein